MDLSGRAELDPDGRHLLAGSRDVREGAQQQEPVHEPGFLTRVPHGPWDEPELAFELLRGFWGLYYGRSPDVRHRDLAKC